MFFGLFCLRRLLQPLKALKRKASLALLAKNVTEKAMLHYLSNTLVGLFGLM
jgi:hypothetical protein